MIKIICLLLYKVLTNNIFIMDTCDCCYEQCGTSTTCKFGHKICFNCSERLNYNKCLFCNPLQKKSISNHNYLQDESYNPEFIFTFKMICFIYFSIIFLSCFYIDGFIWMFIDFTYHFVFNNHEFVWKNINIYYPSLGQCLCGFISKSILFISYFLYNNLELNNELNEFNGLN